MTKRKAIIGVVTVMFLGVGAWAFGFFGRTDPAIAELQQIGDQMWDRSLPEAQRDQLRNDFRQRMESMSDDQRRAFFDASRDQWSVRSQQRMDEFFAMSKAEQQKRLDEIINRMIQSRNSSQQNAGRGGPQSQGNQGGDNNRRGSRGADDRGGGSRSGDGNRGGRRNMTDAQRDARSKRRLDRTTPKMRAQYAEFRKRLDARAQQRGISLGEQRGWGFGGFGGGRRG